MIPCVETVDLTWLHGFCFPFVRVASTVEIGVGMCDVVEILRGFVLEFDTAVGAPVFFGLNR